MAYMSLKNGIVSKRYTAIVKVAGDRFVKYRNVRNLARFTAFLDTSFKGWRYFNLFNPDTKEQVGNYTNRNRPA